jgi:hypothetical protein
VTTPPRPTEPSPRGWKGKQPTGLLWLIAGIIAAVVIWLLTR